MYLNLKSINQQTIKILKPLCAALLSAAVLTACGGGGGGGSDSGNNNNSSNTSPTPASNVASSSSGATVASTGGRNAEAVIDGDGSVLDGWQADATGDQLTITLDQAYTIDSMSLFQRGLGSTGRYTLETSEDNVTYTPISLLFSSDCLNSQFSGELIYCELALPRSLQYIRLTVNSDIDQVQLFELQLFQGEQTLEQFVNNAFIVSDRTSKAIAIDWTLPLGTEVQFYTVYQNGLLLTAPDDEGYVASGLDDDTEYVYQIGLVNSSDEEFLLSKNLTVSTLPDQAVIPEAPETLVFNTILRDEIEIQWDNTTADNENGYRILRDGVEIDTTDFDQNTYIDAGLTAETEYTYSVVAFNDAGDSEATTESFTTLQAERVSLNPPANIATSATTDSITVTFDAATDNPDGYLLLIDGISDQFICNGSTITECAATGLDSNTTYDLSIRAVVYTRRERTGTNEVVWSSEETISETTLTE